MVRHVEQQDLRGADQQRGLGAGRVARHAAVETGSDDVAQRAEPAQHPGDDAADQGAVAVGEMRQPDMRAPAVELLVERPARRSTPSRMSAAMRRAASPGVSLVDGCERGDMTNPYLGESCAAAAFAA